MDPRTAYILDYFRRIYRVPAEVEIGYGTRDRRINIHAGSGRFFEGDAPYPAEKVIWKNWRERDIPVLFGGDPQQPLLTVEGGRAFIHHDLLAAGPPEHIATTPDSHTGHYLAPLLAPRA